MFNKELSITIDGENEEKEKVLLSKFAGISTVFVEVRSEEHEVLKRDIYQQGEDYTTLTEAEAGAIISKTLKEFYKEKLKALNIY